MKLETQFTAKEQSDIIHCLTQLEAILSNRLDEENKKKSEMGGWFPLSFTAEDLEKAKMVKDMFFNRAFLGK
jgi:hypothetical protein